MALNEMIAQGAQFYTPDPAAQYNKLAQMQQLQQTNVLNQMKMDEYQRGLQEQNALRDSVSSNFDINNPTHVNAVLRASPTAGAAFLEKYSQGIKEQGLAEKSKNEAIKFNLDNSRSLLVSINDQPSYNAWRAYSVKKLPDLATILPLQFSTDIKNSLLQTADDVSKRLTAPAVYQNAAPGTTVLKDGVPIYTADEKTKVTDLMANYQAALDQGFKGSIFDYERKLKEAGRTPAQARPEQPPVAVVDPISGKQVYVTREQALSGRMTPANAMESLPPKEIQRRESVLPQATQSVKATEQNADSLIADLQALKNNVGLSGITGFFAGQTPNLSGPARSAQADFNKIKAQGTLGVLTALRASSKTGGALGNTSDKDVQLLGNAFGALDQKQNTEDFKNKIDDAIYATQRAKHNAREAYDMTYEYKTTAPSSPATAPSRPAPATNVITNPQYPGFSIGKP